MGLTTEYAAAQRIQSRIAAKRPYQLFVSTCAATYNELRVFLRRNYAHHHGETPKF